MKAVMYDFSVQLKYLSPAKLSLMCIFQICPTFILERLQKEKWNWKHLLLGNFFALFTLWLYSS